MLFIIRRYGACPPALAMTCRHRRTMVTFETRRLLATSAPQGPGKMSRWAEAAARAKLDAGEAFPPVGFATKSVVQKLQKMWGNEQNRIKIGFLAVACPLFAVFMHYVLRWDRQNKLRDLDEELPPIEWEQFVAEHLDKGQVESITYDTEVRVGNVYLSKGDEAEGKKGSILSSLWKGQKKIDVRFNFPDSTKELRSAIDNFNEQLKLAQAEGKSPEGKERQQKIHLMISPTMFQIEVGMISLFNVCGVIMILNT